VMPTYQGRITPGQVAAIIELIKSIRDVPARPALAPGAAPVAEQGLPPAGAFGLPAPQLPIEVAGRATVAPEGAQVRNREQPEQKQSEQRP
jgi:hypothetical protein